MRDLYDDRAQPPAIHPRHQHHIGDGTVFAILGGACLLIAAVLVLVAILAGI